METNDKVIWVQGNTQPLLIPMEQEVVTPQDEIEVTPFYPDADDEVMVYLTGGRRCYSYTPTVDGNLLTIVDDGHLPAGCYNVEVVVKRADGTGRLHSRWDHQVIVTASNNSVLKEWDEFKQQGVQARAALFFFAKGDPFTYEDFTPEQIADLKKPATDAAAEITADYAELKSDYADVKRDAQAATQAASDAATLANDKAGYANTQGDYAKDQGDYAKNQGDYAKGEIDTAKGDYGSLDARFDDKLDGITEEEFDEIFT